MKLSCHECREVGESRKRAISLAAMLGTDCRGRTNRGRELQQSIPEDYSFITVIWCTQFQPSKKP